MRKKVSWTLRENKGKEGRSEYSGEAALFSNTFEWVKSLETILLPITLAPIQLPLMWLELSNNVLESVCVLPTLVCVWICNAVLPVCVLNTVTVKNGWYGVMLNHTMGTGGALKEKRKRLELRCCQSARRPPEKGRERRVLRREGGTSLGPGWQRSDGEKFHVNCWHTAI